MVRRSAGWNLGVSLIEDAEPVSAGDLGSLDEFFLKPLAQADTLLVNVDRPPANPNILRNGDGVWAIDFDACLYFGRLLAAPAVRQSALLAGHFLANTPYDLGPPHALDADAVREIVGAIPDEWFAGLPLPRSEFAARLVTYCT